MTKPKVVTVSGIDSVSEQQDIVQIVFNDDTSLVQKWCVTNKNSYASCKWKAIEAKASPVVNYTVSANGVYYAFAKDTAGNISDSYKFEIKNI